MSVAELKKYMLKAKYARHDSSLKRRENRIEAINRVRQMQHEKYRDKDVAELIDEAYDGLIDEVALGSQRVLQFGGHPVFQHNARAYNCCTSYANRLRFFQESFYLLLCGSGVGFSVQKHHVAMMPGFSKCRLGQHESTRNGYATHGRTKTFVIPDTIEGWSDALGVLLSSYMDNPIFPEYADCDVQFDPSLIRPKGSYISSGAGRAPGPEPLMKALRRIKALLKRCLANGQGRLRPIDVYDIVMHAADAVLAGGVRRSATICIFSPDDEEMLTAKTGNWMAENRQRSRSNNSALLVRGTTTREEFSRMLKHSREWGEPGFVWADSTEIVYNPCTEAGMWPMLRIGEDPVFKEILKDYNGPIGYDNGPAASGFQMCNLSSVNGALVEVAEDFYYGCRIAAIVGTLQAGYSDFPYLGRVTEEIVRAEALLGVSITGVMENPEVLLDPEVLRRGAQIVLETNAMMAEKLGINPCARGTCLKPEGSGSLMLGVLSNGCHPRPFNKGLKRVQASEDEPVFKHFQSFNPHACETSVWDSSGTTQVMTFPIELPEGGVVKEDISAVDFLKNVKSIFDNWIVPGRRPERCTQPWLQHSVSNTVSVRDDEWEHAEDFIYENRESFAGVSLLSFTGDKDYPQAPYVAVYNRNELVDKYGSSSVGMARRFVRGAEEVFPSLWDACDAMIRNGAGETPAQKVWLLSVAVFATYRCGGDMKKATYLLKDVANLDHFERLKSNMKPVDYESLIEEEDSTDLAAESGCAGGACLI